MAEEQGHGVDDGPVLAKNCTVDAFVAIALLIFGIVEIVESQRLGAGWTSDGPGAGYFPFYIGVIICISAIGIFYQAT
ncbi:MAG: tripartite tricarboxylate transporter TctB family protein, partial [Burkholderiaceae bacterium]